MGHSRLKLTDHDLMEGNKLLLIFTACATSLMYMYIYETIFSLSTEVGKSHRYMEDVGKIAGLLLT